MASDPATATPSTQDPPPPTLIMNKSRSRSTFAMTMTHSATTTTTTHIHTLPKTRYPVSLSSDTSKSPKVPLPSKGPIHLELPPAYESSSSVSGTDGENENGSIPDSGHQYHETSSRSRSRAPKLSRNKQGSSEAPPLPLSDSAVSTTSEEKKHRTVWRWEVAVINVDHTFFATIFGVVLGISGTIVSVVALLVARVVPSFGVKPPPSVSPSNSTSGHRKHPSRIAPLISAPLDFPLVGIIAPSRTVSSSVSTLGGDRFSMKRVTFQLGQAASTSESVYLPSSSSGASILGPASPQTSSPTSTNATLVNSPDRPSLTIADSFGSTGTDQSHPISPDESVDSAHTVLSSASSASTLPVVSCPPSAMAGHRKHWRRSGKTTPSPNTSDAEHGKASLTSPKKQIHIKIPGLKSLKRLSLPVHPVPAVPAAPEESKDSPSTTPVSADPKAHARRFSLHTPTPSTESTASTQGHNTFCPILNPHPHPPAPRLRTNPYLPPFNAVPRTNSTRRRREKGRLSSDVESSAGEEALTPRTTSSGSQGLPPTPPSSGPSEFGEKKTHAGTTGGLGLGRPTGVVPRSRVSSDSAIPSSHSATLSPSPLRSTMVPSSPSLPLHVSTVSFPPTQAQQPESDRFHQKSPLVSLGSRVKRRFSLRTPPEAPAAAQQASS